METIHILKRNLVVEPKQKSSNLITGVGILPMVEDKIGLIQIYRPAIRNYSWEIPHGFVDEGGQIMLQLYVNSWKRQGWL